MDGIDVDAIWKMTQVMWYERRENMYHANLSILSDNRNGSTAGGIESASWISAMWLVHVIISTNHMPGN